jgi:epoxyqueuosine reductase QueG
MRSWDRGQVGEVLDRVGVDAWGVAANVPPLPLAPSLPTAVALLKRFEAVELRGVEHGPHKTYYAGYLRLNAALDTAATTLVEGLRAAGAAAEYVPPTVPEELYDTIVDWGDAGVFAHKTAATRAGLGWIGKTALFVSPQFGPRVRLATVFTDLALEAGTPVAEGRCGTCRRCVDACPAGAGRDVTWQAGMPRELLYDEKACEAETERYPDLGGVCGVCIAACPWGRDG